jgi:hypothetical protein
VIGASTDSANRPRQRGFHLHGKCSTGRTDGSVLVSPGDPDLSAIVARMRSRSPSSQMPPLGTVVRDQAAVDAMTRWIAGTGSDRRRLPD